MYYYDLLSALITSTIVSPIMTITDLTIVKSQVNGSGNNLSGFWRSCINTAKNNRGIKPHLLMNSVYTSTYAVANITRSYCKNNDIDYKIPTLVTTSAVNMSMIAYKDRKYTQWILNTSKNFPLKSYALFGLRDSITIFSSFIAKNDAVKYFQTYMNGNTSDFCASIIVPISAQFISTPLHIVAIDMYQNPESKLYDRYHHIKNTYRGVCTGRIIRVLPAFCLGSYINHNLLHLWT